MAAISFDPARQLTLYFRVARDGSKTFSFVDANGTAKDVSGYSFAFSFKYRASDSSNVFSIANGDLTRPSTDKITIPVSSTLTNVAPQEYYWQMDVTLPDTKVHTWLTGSAKFHNGEFDGVTESSTITVDESGSAVTIAISESGGASAIKFATVTGVNAKSGTTTPATSSYTDGEVFLIFNSTSNLSSGVTLNLGGGAKSVVKMGNNTLSASADMLAGAFYFVTYRTSIDKFVIIGDVLIAGDGLARAGATISVEPDAFLPKGGSISGNVYFSMPTGEFGFSVLKKLLIQITNGDQFIMDETGGFTITATNGIAFNLTESSDATGDLYYRNSSGKFTRLPAGTEGQVLTMRSGIPTWE